MPVDPSIIAGIPVVGQVASAIMQGAQNKKSRKWSEKMYGIQRQDSLADYNMQNQYNSPAATMQRLKAAGLNPNLVYGDGATTTAAPVRSSSVESAEFNAPNFDTSSVMGTYQNARNMELQTDNLRKQNELLAEQAQTQRVNQMLQASQVNKSNVDADLSSFELGLKQKLEQNSLEMAGMNLHKLKADTDYTIGQNFRSALLADATLTENAERVLNLIQERTNMKMTEQEIKARTSIMKKDGALKDAEIKLRKEGFSPNDPAYIRVIIQQLQKFGLLDQATDYIRRKTSSR